MSDAVLSLLAYDQAAKALICLNNSCRYALQAATVRRHLLETHRVDVALAQEAQRYVASLPDLRAPAQLPLPANGSPQHPLLRVYSVFQCCHCSCIVRNRKSMKVHGNRYHALCNVADAELFCSAKAQSWTAGNRQRYWIIDQAASTDNAVVAPDNSSQAGAGRSNISDLAAQTSVRTEKMALQRRQLQPAPSADELTPWLKHTGWNAALTMTTLTFQQLAAFKRLPDAAETALRCLTAAFDRIVQRAIATITETDADLLLWLHSPRNESAAKRPFAAPQDAATLPRYAAYWKSLLCYALRTAPQDSASTATATGVQYNGVQQWQINAIQRQLASGSAHNMDALERSTADNGALDALVFELCT